MKETLWKHKPKVFRRGLPTDVDVKKLRDRFPDASLKPGFLISYTTLEETLGVPRHVSRFGNILRRWRTLVEAESGIIIGCRASVGLVVCDEPQKAQLSSDKYRIGMNSVKRGFVVASHVDVRQLSEDARKAFTHNTNVMANVIAIAQVKKTLELPVLA